MVVRQEDVTRRINYPSDNIALDAVTVDLIPIIHMPIRIRFRVGGRFSAAKLSNICGWRFLTSRHSLLVIPVQSANDAGSRASGDSIAVTVNELLPNETARKYHPVAKER